MNTTEITAIEVATRDLFQPLTKEEEAPWHDRTLEIPIQRIPIALHCHGDTNQGKVRENNEDTLYFAPEKCLFAVIDGMGGMAAGEVAANLTRTILQDTFMENTPTVEGIVSVFTKAQECILANAREHTELRGMGCAAVVALFEQNHMTIANVGDCRAYHLRNSGEMILLSQDDSMAALLQRRGEMTPDEARTSSRRNHLLQAIGQDSPLEVHLVATPVFPGEQVLLCSDGLWDVLTDTEIQEILMEASSPSEAVSTLILRANEGGGPDNITVTAIEIMDLTTS